MMIRTSVQKLQMEKMLMKMDVLTSQVDTDGDGVTDDIFIPDTPDGEIVDENGCSDS